MVKEAFEVSGHDTDRVTERGVDAEPQQVVSVTAGTNSEPVRVKPGRTYELRTDAQEVIVVGTAGVLSYPFAWVVQGTTPRATRVDQGSPFSRVAPLRVTPQRNMLTFNAAVTCRVWILQVSEDGDDGACDGSCGCATAGCTSCGPVPEKKRGKGCGCRRA